MDYKLGDKVEFILNGVLLKGEIISIKRWPFKKYRVAYKNMNIVSFHTSVAWIKAKDLTGIDRGEDRSGFAKIQPPSRPCKQK